MHFTDIQIRSLKPRSDRYIEQEDAAKGSGKLGIRVSPNGHKTWLYTYNYGGKVRRLTLGQYPQMSLAAARQACAEAMCVKDQGRDPGAIVVEKRAADRRAPTFAALADLYLDEYARNKRDGGKSDSAALQRDVLPVWGRHKAEAIERRDVRALLKGIVDRGAPIQANRTLALVRKLFNWALEQDIVKANPCLGVKPPGKEQQRDRVLSDDELEVFLAKLPAAQMTEVARLALTLQLLTAQRCGEVAALRWDEIDRGGNVWTIPKEKAKNGLAHRVPLSEQALTVLAQAKALNPETTYVFPSPVRDGPMVETALSRALHRNVEHFGLPAFSPHDLRRTAASGMTGMGISRLVVSKILNHVERGVTAVYDRHSYDGEKRGALVAWGRRVGELLVPVAARQAVD